MNFKYIWIVFRKELVDSFRDKKTIIFGILIPLLILPVLSIAMKEGMSKFTEGDKKPIEIALIYEEESFIINYLKNEECIKIIETNTPEIDLEESKIKLILKIPKGFDEKVENKIPADILISYDNSSQQSNIAKDKVVNLLSNYSNIIKEKRLKELGINPSILNVFSIESNGINKESGEGLMLISILLPMMLTIWAASGGIAQATDLGAGEKERQTLEPLLTTDINRLSLFLGKYFTIVLLGMLGTTSALIGYFISTRINPNLVGSGVSISLESILIITTFCIGLTMFFSAIEFAISVYARNFKEAQTYLAPIPIIAMIPAYATMFLDSKGIPEIYFHIPIINTIAIIKESIINIFNPIHLITVLLWTITYVIISMFFTVKMFNKESVIFRN